MDNLGRYHPGSPVTLDASKPLLTLDYGAEIGGFPFVEVEHEAGSAAQLELKYTEAFLGLQRPRGDGP